MDSPSSVFASAAASAADVAVRAVDVAAFDEEGVPTKKRPRPVADEPAAAAELPFLAPTLPDWHPLHTFNLSRPKLGTQGEIQLKLCIEDAPQKVQKDLSKMPDDIHPTYLNLSKHIHFVSFSIYLKIDFSSYRNPEF